MDSKRVWSKEETYSLIESIQECPELWNVKAKEYRDRNKKQKALKNLAEKYDTTEAEIQRKLHNLRTQFNQEIKKVKKRKSGDGVDDLYKSSWEYFDALKFLMLNESSSAETADNLTVSKRTIQIFVIITRYLLI